MSYDVNDILLRLKTIEGNSIIAWSVSYIIANNEINNELLAMMISQIKDQIHDNPEMMKQILTPDNYTFFNNINLSIDFTNSFDR